MNREAFLEAILLDVDGPQIIVVRDTVGTSYIGLLTESSRESDTFLCTAASTRRLADLRQGRMDLREAFLTPELTEYFAGRLTNVDDNPPRLLLDRIDTLPVEWLPDEGFFLHDFLQAVPPGATTIVSEATERHRAIVHFTLNPPEASEAAKINADRLAVALEAFQNLVRHAYRRAIAGLSGSLRARASSEDNYTLEVFGFATGSFEVRLQSKASADLLGYSNLSRALKKIDELTAHLESPEVALEVAKQNRGHFVKAYQNLLRFIAESGTPMTYYWADPAEAVGTPRKISREAASSLYELLVSRQELSVEQHVLIGSFIKADVRNGSWTLLTAEKKEYHGQLVEGQELSLSGIILDTRLYRIVCEERIEETIGSGRQSTKLFLRELQAL